MKKPFAVTLLAVIASVTAGTVLAQDKFLIQLPIKMEAAGANVDRIRVECNLEKVLANYVQAKVVSQFPGSGTLDGDAAAPAGAKVLRLTVVSVFGAGGGAYSGTKQMGVRADILADKKTLATTIKERQSMGGAAGLFGGGTCAAFNKLSEVLAADITTWMISPQ